MGWRVGAPGEPLAGVLWMQSIVQPAALLLPGVVGVFAAAPLLPREFEQRTHALAWTQSITRRRWLVAKLVLLGAAVAAGGRPQQP